MKKSLDKVWTKKSGKSVGKKWEKCAKQGQGNQCQTNWKTRQKKGWKKYGKIWEKCAKQGKGNQCQTLKVKF